jgi:hypothetical protein
LGGQEGELGEERFKEERGKRKVERLKIKD